MIYLLDTHVIVWLATEPRRVSQAVIEHITDPGAKRAISVVSGWEYGHKRRRRREQLPRAFDLLVAQINARNESDRVREVQPIVVPQGAPIFMLPDVAIPEEHIGRFMAIIDTSADMTKQQMSQPVATLIAAVLNS